VSGECVIPLSPSPIDMTPATIVVVCVYVPRTTYYRTVIRIMRSLSGQEAFGCSKKKSTWKRNSCHFFSSDPLTLALYYHRRSQVIPWVPPPWIHCHMTKNQVLFRT
jgi:hypothetical protein